MTSTTHGMNAAEVEALGRRLQNDYAERLREIVNQVEKLVSATSSQWLGKDGNDFRSWWPAKRTRMLSMADDLHGFGQSALNNASEQRHASGEGGGSGGDGVLEDRLISATAPNGHAPQVAGARDWREVQSKYDAWATGRFADPNESQYQCTGWANFRWAELGYSGSPIGGNGGAMAGNAPGEVSTTPSLHAMASYGAGTRDDPGHVMIVEEISADGTRIRVSEMNTGTDGSSWTVGNPQEYRDTKWISVGPGGVFKSWNGQTITFAAFPR